MGGPLKEFYMQIESGMLDKFIKKLRAPKYSELVSLHEQYIMRDTTLRRVSVLFEDNLRRGIVFEELCDREVVNPCCCGDTFDADWKTYRTAYGDDAETAMSDVHTLHCVTFVYRKYIHIWLLRAGAVVAFFLSLLVFVSEIFIWTPNTLPIDLNPVSLLMR